jgi:hypothetical protein
VKLALDPAREADRPRRLDVAGARSPAEPVEDVKDGRVVGGGCRPRQRDRARQRQRQGDGQQAEACGAGQVHPRDS